MKRHLPPFAAVRAFEFAAKYESFKKAAKEANLSASSISHQIRSLEHFLGIPLFIRKNGNVKLTESGRKYYYSISQIMADLERATIAIKPHQDSNKVLINLDHSLMTCWLEGSIQRFRVAHPAVEIEFISSETQPDYDVVFDLSIYFAKKPIKGSISDHLADDLIQLVASPELAKKLPDESNMQDLVKQTFLHCSTDPTEWEHWFAANQLEYPKSRNKLTSNFRAAVLNSATNHAGIAIGRQPYLSKYLQEKTLVTPYKKSIATGYHYYLMTNQLSEKSTAVKQFKAWVINESKQFILPK